jgi:Bacterial extracellular solute-binding proteins, family 5 Middle
LRAPPSGIISIHQALFADIAAIDTPDATTVVMQLKAPDASFLDTLALPYKRIYSAKWLAQDANYPAKNVMGSGPFVFVEHVNGSHWVGKLFDPYWDSAKSYLDGFRATFIKSQAVVTALQGGQIQPSFAAFHRANAPNFRTASRTAIRSRNHPGCARLTYFSICKRNPPQQRSCVVGVGAEGVDRNLVIAVRNRPLRLRNVELGVLRRLADAPELVDHEDANGVNGRLDQPELEILGARFGQETLGLGSRFFHIAYVTGQAGKFLGAQGQRRAGQQWTADGFDDGDLGERLGSLPAVHRHGQRLSDLRVVQPRHR